MIIHLHTIATHTYNTYSCAYYNYPYNHKLFQPHSYIRTCSYNIQFFAEADAISKLSERMIQLSLAQPFEVDKNTWPPFKLTVFTPLLLMHHKGQRNLKQANAMAKLTGTGDIDNISSIANDQSIPTHFHRQNSHESLKEVLNDSTTTKEIADILVPLDNKCGFCFILIEGPPGIGKSFLLKEILYIQMG